MRPGRNVFAVFASFSMLLFAVHSKAQTPPSENTSGGQAEASISAQSPINVVLDSSVDSKKAKQGDPVKAHVAEAVKSPDNSTVLPKGTKLIGHVTRAAARSKGDSESMLGIQFDKAELKGQQEKSLGGMVVEAVAAPSEAASSFGGGPSGVPSGGGNTASNNPSMSGSRGTRQDTRTPQSTQPGNPNMGSPEEPSATGPLPPNARGVYGLEGMSLARNPGSGETVITSKGKNVRLDSGTRLLLAPQQQGSAAPVQ
jgi:hypothetical protein